MINDTKVKPKREWFYSYNGKDYIVELHKGFDIFPLARKRSMRYVLDSITLKVDNLDDNYIELYKDDFFFIHPIENVLVKIDNYNDSWYSLNAGTIKKRTLPLVKECLKILRNMGLSDDNLVCFVKKEDSLYYLVVDESEFGYLDYKSTDDAEFKNMLSFVLKDVGFMAEVIALPSKGRKSIYSNTVGVYKTREDFDKVIEYKSRENSVFFK